MDQIDGPLYPTCTTTYINVLYIWTDNTEPRSINHLRYNIDNIDVPAHLDCSLQMPMSIMINHHHTLG
jgi:hypothetical protein